MASKQEKGAHKRGQLWSKNKADQGVLASGIRTTNKKTKQDKPKENKEKSVVSD